jgi:hypothetical protein
MVIVVTLMARIVRDLVGDSLNVTTSVGPTTILTSTIVGSDANITFVQSSPIFTMKFTKMGNIVFFDWSECRGTISGVGVELRTSISIPLELVPPAANIGDAFSICPSLTTTLVPYGIPDSGAGVAAQPFIGFQFQSGTPYLIFGINSTAPLTTGAGEFILYAGSMCYHV